MKGHVWISPCISILSSGPCINIKMLSYQYRKSHCGDQTVVRSSYLHNGISYTGKMSSLYWFRPLNEITSIFQCICQMCIERFLPRIASSPGVYELITELMLADMKDNIFRIISTIMFPNVSTLCSLSSLSVIYCNLYGALKCCIEK